MKMRKLVVMGVLVLLLSACSLSGDSIDGKVMEEGTGKPLADAIVVVHWVGDFGRSAGARATCYHIETARTDATGSYHIPAWSDAWHEGFVTVSGKTLYVNAYKAGYAWSETHRAKPQMISLAPFKGSIDAYFENLYFIVKSNAGCGGSDRNVQYYRLNRAVYEEAQALAETPEQKRMAAFFASLAKDMLGKEIKLP